MQQRRNPPPERGTGTRRPKGPCAFEGLREGALHRGRYEEAATGPNEAARPQAAVRQHNLRSTQPAQNWRCTPHRWRNGCAQHVPGAPRTACNARTCSAGLTSAPSPESTEGLGGGGGGESSPGKGAIMYTRFLVGPPRRLRRSPRANGRRNAVVLATGHGSGFGGRGQSPMRTLQPDH